jgi:capsular polysaccharide export protein
MEYIFFPMQVSDDANLLLNSTMGNMEALEYAASEAEKSGLALFVKPHPAERDPGHIKEILHSKERLGFQFVSGNTINIMQHAERVITINSTAGLQAKLLERDVTVLGKAFWSGYSREDIAAYIMNYLIDLDFWSPEEITVNYLERILARCNIRNS